jgi:molybdopterin converting factor small subunit
MAATRSQDNVTHLAQASENSVVVEFYGVARLRAGRELLLVKAETVRDALQATVHACPELVGLLSSLGELHPQYLISVNGQRFLNELDRSLTDGDQVLLLGADSGG